MHFCWEQMCLKSLNKINKTENFSEKIEDLEKFFAVKLKKSKEGEIKPNNAHSPALKASFWGFLGLNLLIIFVNFDCLQNLSFPNCRKNLSACWYRHTREYPHKWCALFFRLSHLSWALSWAEHQPPPSPAPLAHTTPPIFP